MDQKPSRGKSGHQRSFDENRNYGERRPTSGNSSPTEQPRPKIQRTDRLAGEGTSGANRNARRDDSRSGEGTSRSYNDNRRYTSESGGEGNSRSYGDNRRQISGSYSEGTSRSYGDSSNQTPEYTPTPKNVEDRALTRNNRYEIIQTKPSTLTTKKGNDGKPVLLTANYFVVSKRPEWNIYQYHVDFSPTIESNRLKQGILSNYRNMLGGYLFDGAQLYLVKELSEKVTTLQVKSKQNDEYMITIKFCGIINMSQWQSLQVLNLILRRSMQGLKLQLVGKNFYDALGKIDVREFALQLWPGYITSIRQHERDILVCAEVSHKYMRTETLYDMMRNCGRSGGDWQDEFRRKVIGMVVLTDYNNMTYRVDDIDFNSSPNTTFDMKGVPKTYIDYYMTKYQIRIRDCKQPLLVSQNKTNRIRAGAPNLVLLIPELCRATGLTEEMKQNNSLKIRLGRITKPDPRNRIESLMHFNRRLQDTSDSQQILRDWNVKLERNLVEVEGRILSKEQIYLQSFKYDYNNDDWNQAFKNHNMYNSIPLKKWAVISPQDLARDSRNFIENLINVARRMGMEICQPDWHPIQDDRSYTYQRELDIAANQDPQLIMAILKNNAADKYSVIKKKCCFDRPIPTQILTRRVLNNNLTISTKVAIQLNAKLGGTPWLVSLPLTGLMVVGFDICKSKTDRSVVYGAIVATMDQKLSPTYFSTVIRDSAFDMFSNNLILGLTKALHAFKSKCGAFPTKIIFYRTSVGDGSIKQVLEYEVETLVKKIDLMYESSKLPKAKFTFIMISKSINTRFFVNNNRFVGNPVPGTIIDDVVTLPERYDFYLVSQTTRQGTVTPTSYNVLYDTSGLSPNQLQILTYKFCHLYYNWNGTTRVPAVCQYAKKLASLVGEHLQSEPSSALERLLYFI